jgi:hypothetical protein
MTHDRSRMSEIIEFLRREGSRLTEPVPMDGMPPMTFTCEFSLEKITSDDELSIPGYVCPNDLKNFWRIACTARLFEDKEYGQWGLEILTPQDAVEATSHTESYPQRDFIPGDLVIGRFIGDSDLLVIRCDESKDDFGRIIVANPIDPRSDWDQAAYSLCDFLERYSNAGGAKYWSPRP